MDIKEFERLPIVFITGVGRCGLYLLKTSLDWHEQILIITVGIKFYSVWKKFGCDQISDPDKIVDIFLSESKLKIFKSGEYFHEFSGEAFDVSNIKWDILELVLREYVKSHELNSRNVYLGILYAYTMASGKDINNIRVLIADASYKDFLTEIFRDFPEARIIQIIRDYRGNIQSLKKFFLCLYGSLCHPKNGQKFFLYIIRDQMLPALKMLDSNKKVFYLKTARQILLLY